MKKLSLILASVLVFGMSMTVSAKEKGGSSETVSSANHDITVNIPSYSLVGISSGSAITLKPGVPSEAGDGLDFSASSAMNNSIWLNYSSILSGDGSNSISVEMSGDPLPTGVFIELEAGEDAGKGEGVVGHSEGAIALELDGEGQNVITGIGNCYTGKGSTSGHQLTYTLKMSDDEGAYAALVSGSYTTNIVYTITDN